MRSLLIGLLLTTLAQTALAAPANCPCQAVRCAQQCCNAIRTERLQLHPHPLCTPPRHHAAAPLTPCACTSPVTLCHKPATPQTPCACTHPPRKACHKPAVAVIPEVDCPPTIELTGSPDLIQDCGCNAPETKH